MTLQSKFFLSGKEETIEQVDDGIKRQILGYNNDIMLVKAMFEEGSIGYIHSHMHSQVTYVESGVFEVTVDDKTQTLEAGDAFYIPPHIDHGAVCKTAGVLIDVFSPHREDFLQQEDTQ